MAKRAKVKPEKCAAGWTIVAVLPDGSRDYPTAGLCVRTKEIARTEIENLYAAPEWDLKKSGAGYSVKVGYRTR
jgi:hypothetical protein